MRAPTCAIDQVPMSNCKLLIHLFANKVATTGKWIFALHCHCCSPCCWMCMAALHCCCFCCSYRWPRMPTSSSSPLLIKQILNSHDPEQSPLLAGLTFGGYKKVLTISHPNVLSLSLSAFIGGCFFMCSKKPMNERVWNGKDQRELELIEDGSRPMLLVYKKLVIGLCPLPNTLGKWLVQKSQI